MSRVEICGETADGKPIRQLAFLEDRTAGGMGLRAGAQFPVGSKLQIKYKNEVLPGIIRHCTWSNTGYIIGVELVQPSPPGKPLAERTRDRTKPALT